MLITKFPVKTCQKLEGINKCNIWFINERSNIAQKNLVQCFPDISWLLRMNERKNKKKIKKIEGKFTFEQGEETNSVW